MCQLPASPSPHPARKSLGQHFLRRPEICARIAALLQSEAGDSIIEIGPGPGALTNALESTPHASLLLLEKDAYWARERQRAAGPRTQAVLMDALRFAWRRVTPACSWRITGNLPYNVASPLIWDVLSQATGWQRAVFMVQKEVGQRLAAVPGNRHYGALSVWVQSFARPRLEFCVGPGAFTPPPKVDSAVLSFTPLPETQRASKPEALARLLRVCFQQRRKQLRNIFRHNGLFVLAEALEALGIAGSARPENLSNADFRRLAVFWAAQLDKGSPKDV